MLMSYPWNMILSNHSEHKYLIITTDNNIKEIQWTLMSSKLRVYLFWFLTWEAFPRYKAAFQKYRITSIFPMEGINSNKQTKLCLEKRTSKNPSYVLFWISKCIEKIKCIIINWLINWNAHFLSIGELRTILMPITSIFKCKLYSNCRFLSFLVNSSMFSRQV